MSDTPWSVRVSNTEGVEIDIDNISNERKKRKKKRKNRKISDTVMVRKRVLIRGNRSSDDPSASPDPEMFSTERRLTLGASGHNKVLEALQIFQSLDTNGEGVLSFDELTTVIPGDADTVRAQLKALDKDGDGKISRLDFVEGLHIFYGDAGGSDDEDSTDEDENNDNSQVKSLENNLNSPDNDMNRVKRRTPRRSKKFLSKPGLNNKRLSIGRTWAARNVYTDMQQCLSNQSPSTHANDSAAALAKILFEVLDVDSTGCLGRKGFKESWMDMDPASRENVEKLFSEIDTLETNVVTKTEFVEYFSTLTQKELRQMWDKLKTKLPEDWNHPDQKSTTDQKESPPQNLDAFECQLFDECIDQGSDVETFESNNNQNAISLKKILDRREAEILALEKELRQAKLIAQKINRRCEIMGREQLADANEKKKLQRKTDELAHEKRDLRIKSEALETQYKTLEKSMNQKVTKLDALLQETQHEREMVTIKLRKKTKTLKKTLLAHDHLKETSNAQKQKINHIQEKSKKISNKLKKEERNRKRTEEELHKKVDKLRDMEKKLVEQQMKRHSSEHSDDYSPGCSPDEHIRNIQYGPNMQFHSRNSITSSLSTHPNEIQVGGEHNFENRPTAMSLSQQVEEAEQIQKDKAGGHPHWLPSEGSIANIDEAETRISVELNAPKKKKKSKKKKSRHRRHRR